MKKSLRPSVKFKIYKQMRRELAQHYPHAFPLRGKRPPLKVGIVHEIIADRKISCSASQLRFFLSIWTNSTAYLKSVSVEKFRHGIYPGDFSPLVTDHVRLAKKILAERRKNKGKIVDITP